MARGDNRVVYGARGKRTYFIADVEVTEAEWHARFPSKIADLLKHGMKTKSMTPSAWPIVSESLGINPDQVPEAMAADKKRGVTAEFDREGRPIMTSPEHFKQYAKQCGLVHKGYV